MKKEIFLQYLKAITELYGVDKSDILSGSKRKVHCQARFMLYYMCYIRPMSCSEIQRYMASEGYDPQHNPILVAVKKMSRKVQEDKDYQAVIDRIRNKVFI